MLAPALPNVSLWPFDGPLLSLLVPGGIAVAETWPAECYGWFPEERLGSKRDRGNRRKLSASLLRWADAQSVAIKDDLKKEIRGGFPQGDDAFDAVVGLFGMLQVCIGQRAPGGRTTE